MKKNVYFCILLRNNTVEQNINLTIMLTLKLITEETEKVIKGLEKKHFQGAKEAIDEVLNVNKSRKETQQQLDTTLAAQKQMAAKIGGFMKQGLKEEADKAKAEVAEMKATSEKLKTALDDFEKQLTTLLCQKHR